MKESSYSMRESLLQPKAQMSRCVGRAKAFLKRQFYQAKERLEIGKIHHSRARLRHRRRRISGRITRSRSMYKGLGMAPGAAASSRLRRSTSASDAHAACTHMKMVRLFSTEFRCQVCHRHSSLPWLYRCVDDRELIMEQEFSNGTLDKIDALCDIFEPMIATKKRSAAERADKMSFFTEIDDRALKTYTTEQLIILRTQRSLAIETARAKSQSQPSSLFNGSQASSSTPKPWTPKPGDECQFKCCHLCRPNMLERSFLDLDAIVNGDVPLTAAYGFGFHLSNPQGRPVIDAQVVKNLGLRANPPRVRPVSGGVRRSRRFSNLKQRAESALYTSQDRTFAYSQRSPLGLGLLTPEREHPLPAVPTPVHADALILTSGSFVSRNQNTGHDESFQQSYSARNGSQASLPTSAANPFITSTWQPISSTPTTPCVPQCASRSNLHDRLAAANMNVRFETALLTPLPAQTDEELETISASFTEMELNEIVVRQFGEEPLKVIDGVAVTEEAVELHVADVITQI